MSKGKTCGECRHFVVSEDHGGCCTFICDAMCDDDRACYKFQKPTNGDRIRQMSNEELATWGMYDLGTCPTFEKQQSCARRGECSASEIEECWLNWLNAPADNTESEGNNE